MALFPGGGGEVVRERDSPEMGSPKRPRTPRVLATFWASYGPTPPTPIRPKNAQNRALRASSVPRKFRRQNARQLFFLGANIFHKNLPRQLFFASTKRKNSFFVPPRGRGVGFHCRNLSLTSALKRSPLSTLPPVSLTRRYTRTMHTPTTCPQHVHNF